MGRKGSWVEPAVTASVTVTPRHLADLAHLLLLVATVLLLDHHPSEAIHDRGEHSHSVTHRPAARNDRVDLVDLGDFKVVKLLLVGRSHVLAFIDEPTSILTDASIGIADCISNRRTPQVGRSTCLGL